MQLHKTDLARAELKPGVRTLDQRERTLLLLADGNKSVTDFRPLFGGDGEQIALRLVRDGYLIQQAAATAPGSRFAGMPVGKQEPAIAKQMPEHPVAVQVSPAAAVQAPKPEPEQPAAAADRFDGKRSLATTRMFLFDICERMFARRNPAGAERFREALRCAKDREAMLSVSRDIIEEIEKIAGHERADSISERLAMLLPAELSA